jgi:hypothetical protein
MQLTIQDLRRLTQEDRSLLHGGWLAKLAGHWMTLAVASTAFLVALFALIPAWKASAKKVSAITAPGIDIVRDVVDPTKHAPKVDGMPQWIDGLVLAPLRAQFRTDPDFYFRQRANERQTDWLALAQSKSSQRSIDIKAAQAPIAFMPPKAAPVEAVKTVVAAVKRPPQPTFDPPSFVTPGSEPVAVRSHAAEATDAEPPAQERQIARPSGPTERQLGPAQTQRNLLAQVEQDYRAFPAIAAELARELLTLPDTERRSAELKLAEARAHYTEALAERASLTTSDRVLPANLAGAERQAFDACLASNPAIEMIRLVRKPTLVSTQIPAYFVQVRKSEGTTGLDACLRNAGIAGSFTLIVGTP